MKEPSSFIDDVFQSIWIAKNNSIDIGHENDLLLYLWSSDNKRIFYFINESHEIALLKIISIFK